MEEARSLGGDERRGHIWQKSFIKVTEGECCGLVLNAVFYRDPVEFSQKRCDMIALRFFFHDELRGVILDFL